MASPSRDTFCPSSVLDNPRKAEGAGKGGRSPHPRFACKKSTQVVTTGEVERSDLPCANGFNGCFGLSLVIGY
jgi:hypothetical protein